MTTSFHVIICHLYFLFSEMSFHIFCPFSNWIFFSAFESLKFFKIYSGSKSFIYSGSKSFIYFGSKILQIFFHSLWLSFHSHNWFFHKTKVSNFDKFQLNNSFSFMIVLLVLCIELFT